MMKFKIVSKYKIQKNETNKLEYHSSEIKDINSIDRYSILANKFK